MLPGRRRLWTRPLARSTKGPGTCVPFRTQGHRSLKFLGVVPEAHVLLFGRGVRDDLGVLVGAAGRFQVLVLRHAVLLESVASATPTERERTNRRYGMTWLPVRLRYAGVLPGRGAAQKPVACHGANARPATPRAGPGV